LRGEDFVLIGCQCVPGRSVRLSGRLLRTEQILPAQPRGCVSRSWAILGPNDLQPPRPAEDRVGATGDGRPCSEQGARSWPSPASTATNGESVGSTSTGSDRAPSTTTTRSDNVGARSHSLPGTSLPQCRRSDSTAS